MSISSPARQEQLQTLLESGKHSMWQIATAMRVAPGTASACLACLREVLRDDGIMVQSEPILDPRPRGRVGRHRRRYWIEGVR